MEKTNPEQRKQFLQPSTAKGRTRKSYEERAEVRKKCDQYRNQRRVNIGESFDQWRKLRTDLGLTTDAETAELLLNSYERDPSVSTLQKQGTMRPAPPVLSAKTNKSPSDWTCSVVGCDSGRRSAQRYKLPKDPDMRLKWVQFLLEVNEQQLKESSWTDITICSEHFTQDCYDHQTAQLKSEAVPSLCIKPEPEQHLKSPHVVDSTVGPSDDLDTCSTPSFSPTPHPNPMQQKVTTDMKREEASLLQIDKTFLLTEHGLLKLFVHKCPSCDHELQLEQVTNKELIVVNQQCHRCNYSLQWKSHANAGVPTVEHQTGGSEETPECQQATPKVEVPEVPVSQYNTEVITVMNEEAAATEDLSVPEGNNTDEEWTPSDQSVLTESDVEGSDTEESDTEESDTEESDTEESDAEESDTEESDTEESDVEESDTEESDAEESDMEENQSDDPTQNELCADCGTFFNKRRPHMCEHKIKLLSCNICGKRCISEQALRSHSRIHNVNYEFPCKYCSFTFKTKADKMTHEVIHATEEKPYKCPDCSETFASNKERSTHLEVHRGPRQSTCDICQMDFLNPRYLQRHMAVHTGLKPFKCASCSRAFKQARHLKSHMRLHTGERPYKCQYCDKCFNHNVSLKSHIQRYHPSNSVENNTTEKDAGYDIVEQYKPKSRRKQKSVRPIGRPKNSEFGNSTEGHSSHSKTRKPQSKKSERRYSHDEESEYTGDGSSSGSEEERGRKRTKTTATSKGQAENVDSDLDCNPAEVKKQWLLNRTCSVVGCDSGRRSTQRYKLPKDPDMRLKWVQFLLEVNGQQLKESSWTDITICSEHFTQDCYDHQTAQLKSEAVPSLCIKPEPEEHLKSPHVVDNTVGDLDTCSTPSFSPTPHPNPMQQKVTRGMKRKEAALLQIDKTFLRTERGLLKLFDHKCPSCDRELQLEQVANEEVIVVNQQCHRCNYSLQWKSHATEGMPCKCPQCPEIFATHKELSTHLEVHRRPGQSTCDICGMDFLSPRYLRRHMHVHIALKPFKCATCNRAFKQAGHLKSHMRLHTGERPFKCQYCDKCFNHNVSLKIHMRHCHPSKSVEKSSNAENNTTEKDAGYDVVEEEQYKRTENVDRDLNFNPAQVKKRRRKGRPRKKN